MQWLAYASDTTDSLYIQIPEGYRVYYLLDGHTTLDKPSIENDIPEDALPVDIKDCPQGWQIYSTPTAMIP